MRRVVVTGLGMVTPLGCGVEPTWTRILAGQSGAKKIDTFDASDLTCQIACLIPRGDGSDATFNPDQWMEPKDQRKVDDFIIYAMCAARQALDDANWHPSTEEERCATGTLIGSGIGGLSGIADTAIVLKERGPRKVSPFFIPGRLINLASGYVSIEHGLKGPNHSVVTACSTGAHAIGDGARLIALGDADVMVAGGTESPICRIGMAGFCAARALSTGYNETPQKASRPYDKDRDGFVMGEGAGAFTRLIDLGVNSKVITSAVSMAMAQRLVRKLCNSCKKETKISEENGKILEKVLTGMKKKDPTVTFSGSVWEPVGCPNCFNTGYKGRTGIYEAILADEAIENVIRQNPSEREIKKAAEPQNIFDMREDGVLKIITGMTSIEEVERIIDLRSED